MKKVLAAAFIIQAIYWSLPSGQFNTADACQGGASHVTQQK